MRRGVAVGVSALLAATLVQVVAPEVAGADIPSVPLPAIASTPVTAQGMGAAGTDLASDRALRNDQQPGTVKEGGGSTSASPLSPTATWDVSSHTGDFRWTYPLRVPPAPGGLVPNLAMSYRSSEVDGRTSAANNQPSWVGDGWALSPGFIQRSYGACPDDTEGNQPPQVGDLCWRSDNAVAQYSGGGGQLICCDADGRWRSKSDDGSRIERFFGVGNGDNDGEHWKITTVDGTEYWFGSQVDSRSTWTVPVFGDDNGEPCNRPGSFDNSQCQQAWQWSLDKVVDRNGNIIRYYYAPETNNYGMNAKDAAVTYTRGGTLTQIDYGLREDVSTPTGRVVFTTADRCVPFSNCDQSLKNNWPDTDLDNKCDTATCKDRYSPTFWSTKRLASITTQVWRDGAPSNVDRWDLEQAFPDPGDGEKAALWLKSIKHTGLVGGEKSLPAVTFEGNPYANRVDTAADGLAPLNRYRITGVVSETGGWTSVSYASQCKPEGPIPDKLKLNENTLRCFPVRWNKKNHEQRLDFFHKYVVSTVVRSDRMSANTQMVSSYEYLDGAAWHWDTSEFVKEDKKTWNEFRGYGRVRVRTGAGADPAGDVTMSEQRFYRGMNGDKNATGERKVKDSNNVEYVDQDWLSGFTLETATFEREGPSDQPDPPRIVKTINEPVWQGPTATRGAFKAYILGVGVERGYTAVGSGWRTTRVDTTYDDRGLPIKINDLGDTTTADDDRCTRTTYARNTAKWLLNLAGNVETVSVKCDQTAVFPRDALADTSTSFDTNGNVMLLRNAKERPAAGAVYINTSANEYDSYGRPTVTTNALGQVSRTAYTPAHGPVTQTVTTSPATTALKDGLITTTAIEPAWGVPTKITDPNTRITEVAYDPLGRSTQVWLPNRPRADQPTRPSTGYEYQINKDAPTAVITTKVGPNGTNISSRTIYDGFLRARQVQAPAMGGGRLLTDTRYDSHGRLWKSTQPYFNTSSVDSTLWVASDASIPGHTRTHYDSAGRQDASMYFAANTEKWRTTTSYGGDRTTVTPPAGGTAITSITNARGKTTETRQYTTANPSNSFEASSYTYNKAGQIESVKGPDGVTWRYGYDLLGRQTSAEDPDRGTLTTTYNDLGQVETTRDAAGTTVAFGYDTLNRRTGTFLNSLTGTQLTELTYDTAPNGAGLLASTTRFVERNGAKHAYRAEILDYDALNQPTGTSVSIPSIEGLLAGTYESYSGFNPDGSLSGETYPAVGNLPEEEVNYTYYDLGPLKTSKGGFDGKTITHVANTEYTRYGETARIHLGTGTKRAWTSYYYDTNTRRLNRTIVDAEVPEPMQADRHYTYTNAGTITSIADTAPGVHDVQCFQHDHLRRLTQAWTPAVSTWDETVGCKQDPDTNALAGPAPYRLSYTYDQAGNRLKETQHTTGGNTTRDYFYGVPGHAHALRMVKTVGPGGVSTQEDYAYKVTGEISTRARAGGTQAFTWDAEGHVATVTENGKTTSYVYDGNGSRMLRREPDVTTLYLGKQEIRLNHAGGNPTTTRYYDHGGQNVAVRQDKDSLTWLASDHQATNQLAINANTMAVSRRLQLPFGEERGGVSAFFGDRGFVDGTKDASTGLTHLGAREYDPKTGRFISVDPIMNPVDSQQLNGYAYSNNNPVSFSDPTGLYCDSCDFYGRRDGTGSAWTPPDRPQISRTDQQVWRQEKGSKATTVKKVQPAKKVTSPGAPPGKFCVANTGSLLFGKQPVCESIPMTQQQAEAVIDNCQDVPVVGAHCAVGESGISASKGDVFGSIIALLGVIPLGHRIGKIPKALRKACSFAGDTKVVMAGGTTKPISKIKVGEKVLAADPETGRKGPRTVTAVMVHEDTVQEFGIAGGGKITTTEDHPMWNATDKQWQRADQLDQGDKVLAADGRLIAVAGLRFGTRQVTAAYNLTVDDLHTYYVQAGDGAVLVHNNCWDDVGPLRPPARDLQKNEGVLIGSDQGLQSSRGGVFQDMVQGTHGDASTKYLWTIDERGVNVALEQTPFPTPRGNIVHTNLSSQASIGGEAWFGPDNTVTINAGSGRFGDGAGITPKQWEATVKVWEGLGYRVNPVPFGRR